jgi:hypothetical protein
MKLHFVLTRMSQDFQSVSGEVRETGAGADTEQTAAGIFADSLEVITALSVIRLSEMQNLKLSCLPSRLLNWLHRALCK